MAPSVRWRNDAQSWGAAAKLFHWSIAVLVLALLVVGFVMHRIEDVQTRIDVIQLHKSVGLVLLAVMTARLVWRLTGAAPLLPPGMPAWEKLAAQATHWVLYGLLFVMPGLGLLTSAASGFPIEVFKLVTIPSPMARDKALQEFAGGLHEFFAFVLIAVLVVHVGAALRHHFVVKDDILRRMLPGRAKDAG